MGIIGFVLSEAGRASMITRLRIAGACLLCVPIVLLVFRVVLFNEVVFQERFVPVLLGVSGVAIGLLARSAYLANGSWRAAAIASAIMLTMCLWLVSHAPFEYTIKDGHKSYVAKVTFLSIDYRDEGMVKLYKRLGVVFRGKEPVAAARIGAFPDNGAAFIYPYDFPLVIESNFDELNWF